jgi:hypothetical protein
VGRAGDTGTIVPNEALVIWRTVVKSRYSVFIEAIPELSMKSPGSFKGR